MEEGAQLHAVVRGYVQGVGFRFFVLDQAEALGLVGYVRNLRDGRSVEVVAEGLRERVEDLLRDLWRGPRGSRVEGVQVHWGPPTGSFHAFEVRY